MAVTAWGKYLFICLLVFRIQRGTANLLARTPAAIQLFEKKKEKKSTPTSHEALTGQVWRWKTKRYIHKLSRRQLLQLSNDTGTPFLSALYRFSLNRPILSGSALPPAAAGEATAAAADPGKLSRLTRIGA